ncbi:nucleotidyltransferase domain-containing protein [Solitalea koreensis]|uniref:Nucleotidyltransferase domain-containing protein n=1 Tax=Solitalea koreensis TaxID=543615 RepID=A0A521CQ87_9SPHI|nr:nucleotidyltransferase domain-containing protein [Solitalea koreensis]SMO61583.1 Nucleotidyltransferase domain-containing protein [Solitalea koreensis]
MVLDEHTVNAILGIFKKYPEIEKVLIYGSRAMNRHKPSSDIDMTLAGDQLDLSQLLKLENELDVLLLPYKIDLSLFRQIDNQDLIDHINRAGVIFYEKRKTND